MSKKTVLGAFVAVLLGALGSGLWELAKPVFGWAWFGLLTLATLGLDNLRDGMYAEAGRNIGLHVRILARTQMLAALVFTAAAGIILYIRAEFRPQSNMIGRALFLTFMAGSLVMLVGASRTAYIENLANHATRLTVIAAPFVSDADLKRYHSELARVSKRAQYLRVIEELQAIIKRNGVEPPTREFF